MLQEYKTEIKDLEHQGELGNGTCGHVVKMLHKPSQTVIAVKVSIFIRLSMSKLVRISIVKLYIKKNCDI